MTVVQINSTCGTGSTGKICVSVSRLLTEAGMENYILYTHGRSDYPLGIKYAGDWYRKWQALKSRVLGNLGFNSHWATRRLIGELERIRPDIVHIHNIHGHDCHLGMLLDYLREKHIRVVWTLHDGWAFTAGCPCFALAGCDRWKTECGPCPQIRQTSWFFDRSRTLYRRKKAATAGLDLTVITPSRWLAGMVKQSYLGCYPIRVIHNGIDLSVFRPTASDFRRQYGCEDRILLLGVAFDWGYRKGLDVFTALAGRLDDRYRIVLVGTNETVDRQFPANIISIHRTHDQRELAAIYTAADVFVNPTRDEVLGLVNLEALACGTPVITFRSGGSPECVDATCGAVVDCDDVDGMEREILRLCTERPFAPEDCRQRAAQFDARDKFREYIDLYSCIARSDKQ